MFSKRMLLIAAAAAVLCGAPAEADTIKVGVIGPFSGPFAIAGKNFKWGLEAYQAIHGKKVGADEVEFVYRDLEGPDPAKAKAIGQELIVKDKVDYLAGVYFTPNAMTIAPMLEEAKVPMVIFNAATSAIMTKSPYLIRTSFTMWQNTVPMGNVAAKLGLKKVATAVSDYGPGIDAETAFKKTFEAKGGSVPDAIRMPVQTTDFGPIMQRIKDAGVDGVFAFLPSGPPTLAFTKAFIDNGLREKGIRLLTTGDVTHDPDLPALGDGALGILSTYHYAVAHKSPLNEELLAKIKQIGGSPAEVDMCAVGSYDGLHVIYKMIEATGGKRDPAKAVEAVKGLAFDSPRGPVKIDPETRHVRQTVYLREIAKDGDRYINKELEAFPDQPDYGLAQGK
jgi:branched-chain amino acid transport system substrate-binding protein